MCPNTNAKVQQYTLVAEVASGNIGLLLGRQTDNKPTLPLNKAHLKLRLAGSAVQHSQSMTSRQRKVWLLPFKGEPTFIKAKNAKATQQLNHQYRILMIDYMDFWLFGMGSVPMDPDELNIYSTVLRPMILLWADNT